MNSVCKGQRTALGPDTVMRRWNKTTFKIKNPLMQPSFQMIVWSEEYYTKRAPASINAHQNDAT